MFIRGEREGGPLSTKSKSGVFHTREEHMQTILIYILTFKPSFSLHSTKSEKNTHTLETGFFCEEIAINNSDPATILR